MSFFNNMGNNIDITNVKASKYIEGTPKMDKWKKERVTPVIDEDTKAMSKNWKKLMKKNYGASYPKDCLKICLMIRELSTQMSLK